MKAGFFERDVTPPVGVYLAGYPSRKEGSDGVLDPLYLRIAAVEDDAGERLVLVTADLLKFPRDMAWRLKAWCEKTLGLKSPCLIINLSHTHCSPGLFYQACYPHWPVDVEYVNMLEQAIRDGVRAALDSLAPARILFGMHEAHFGINRRKPQPELGGKVLLGANPDGYYDPDLPIMAFYDAGGKKLKAVVYSYACHPTSRGGMKISADYPGEISRGLKRELGEDVMTLFVQGAGGSVATRERDDGTNSPEYQAFWASEAEHIAAFAKSDKMAELPLHLGAAETEFVIPYDKAKIPSQEELLALCDPTDESMPPELRPANRSIIRLWARGIYEKVRTGTLPEGFGMHLAKIRLNDDLQIIALSGEVTAEVGRMIKDLFPDQQTLFFGYCSHTDAYIPRTSMLDEGGHEALASIYFHMRPAPFVEEIDDILKREVLALEV